MAEIPIPTTLFDPRMREGPGKAIASHAIFEHLYTRELFATENRYRRDHGMHPIPRTEKGMYLKDPLLPYVALASLNEFSIKALKTIYRGLMKEGLERNWDAALLKGVEEGHRNVVQMMPEILLSPLINHCVKSAIIGIRGLLTRRRASDAETSHN